MRGIGLCVHLGRYSCPFEDPDKPKADLNDKRFHAVDVEEVLASNKNNFDRRLFGNHRRRNR